MIVKMNCLEKYAAWPAASSQSTSLTVATRHGSRC